MSDDNHSVNSGMLASMNQHQGGGGGHPSGSKVPSPFDENMIGDELATPIDKKSLDFGLGGEGVDKIFNLPPALNASVTEFFEQNMSPGNINAFQGMGHLGHELQNTKIDNLAPGKQMNAPQNFGAPIPDKSGQSQGAGH
jgi:hypothetical protein